MHARGSKIWILRATRDNCFEGRLSQSCVGGEGVGGWLKRGMAGGWVTVLIVLTISGGNVFGAHWAHHTDLEPNYSLYWTPGEQDITFEVQVRSLGYVGFGFSLDGQMIGGDMVIGWVRDNQVFFQDRFSVDRGEPKVDPSQDYELLLGYENGTHTVLRFRRRYDTCDDRDIRITNDTMRVLWAYHATDPTSGGGVMYHGPERRGSRSIYLMEGPEDNQQATQHLTTWDLTNTEVSLPALDFQDTLYWCRIFRIPNIKQKHHMIRYEPLLKGGNRAYLHHIILYECQGGSAEFEEYTRDGGEPCYQPNTPLSNCNTVVLTWNQGSEGFSFPSEAGYPLDPVSGPKYYMMETHYNNPDRDIDITDSSGLRVYYTKTLRRHDAGVLSVGLDPNWRHIIPPGQPKVVSEGHCIADCTRQTIPPQGINIFSVILHTHLIGRQIRLRQIRDGEELTPIAVDNNYDSNYQENRRLEKPVQILPGDHLIAECVYNSVDRTTITLGGLTTREEKCLVYGLYYPRINLSLCHSIPSLPTVLHSLGIQELLPNSKPLRIKSPEDLYNKTLEERLITYNWTVNYHSFQEATHRGSFHPLCLGIEPQMLPVLEDVIAFYPNITKPYKVRITCQHNRRKKPRRKKKPGEEEQDDEVIENDDEDGDGEENVVKVEGLDKSSKIYASVGEQESSRLNHASERNRISARVLLVFVFSVTLVWR